MSNAKVLADTIRVRRGERTDLIYLNHIKDLRRGWFAKLVAWVWLQVAGETRRRVDRA